MDPPPPFLGTKKHLITAEAIAHYQPGGRHWNQRNNPLNNEQKHRKDIQNRYQHIQPSDAIPFNNDDQPISCNNDIQPTSVNHREDKYSRDQHEIEKKLMSPDHKTEENSISFNLRESRYQRNHQNVEEKNQNKMRRRRKSPPLYPPSTVKINHKYSNRDNHKMKVKSLQSYKIK